MNRKNMPHKSIDLVFMTNSGWELAGHWNAHTKSLTQYKTNRGKIKSFKYPLKDVISWKTVKESEFPDYY